MANSAWEMGYKLKIWVLEIGEPLPLEGGVRLHRYGKFTDYLARQGHDVTWWTSSFSHAPKMHFANSTQKLKLDSGLNLYLIRGPGYPRNVSWQRFRHQAHFAQEFLRLAKSESKPDVIVAPVPTLEGARAAADFAKENNIPFVLDVRDCWPDELVNLLPQPLRFLGPLLLPHMYKNMRVAASTAAAIIGVSRDYVQYGLKFSGRAISGLDQVVPLGYETIDAAPADKEMAKKWYQSLAIPRENFVVCFFGTIGRFFDLQTVLAAAQKLRHLPLTFVLGGDGSSLEQYKKEAANLANVIFTGWLNQAQINEVMHNASVGLAPYKVGALMAMPNKPFEYMSAGLPLLVSLKGELTERLIREGAGLSYRADNVEELSRHLKALVENREQAKSMGQEAKRIFEQDFSLAIVHPKFEKLLMQIAEHGFKK